MELMILRTNHPIVAPPIDARRKLLRIPSVKMSLFWISEIFVLSWLLTLVTSFLLADVCFLM